MNSVNSNTAFHPDAVSLKFSNLIVNFRSKNIDKLPKIWQDP